MSRRIKYTVGLWLNVPFNLQIWNIRKRVVKNPDLQWSTAVLAKNEQESLEIAQNEYSNKTKSETA